MNFNFFNKNDDEETTKKPLITMPIKTKMFIVLITFLLGFVLFITSNFWFMTKQEFTSNHIYDVISLSNDINLKLRRWSYNPDTKETEIEIGKNFSTAKDDLKFSLMVLGNGTKFINSTVMYDSENLWVISLDKTPFSTQYIQLDFRVNLNDTEYTSHFIMDLNSNEIEIDKNLNSSSNDENYYITKSISYEIQMLEKTLNNNIKLISDSKKEIENFNLELEELQNSKPTNYTKEELDTLNNKINNINTEINRLTDLIDKKTEENKSLESDIKVLQAKLDEK